MHLITNRFLASAILSLACAVSFSSSAFARTSADENADIEKVRAELAKVTPKAVNSEIKSSPVKGVYSLVIGGKYSYAYVDGDYVLLGELFNTKDQVSLGDRASAERMAKLIDEMPRSKMIVYGPEDAKRHITVFTDIDCVYCRKLHLEVPELNAAGIQVRYLAYPRAGLGSISHKKYISVWCSDDQRSSLTTAKAGVTVEISETTAACDNPIVESYNLGRTVGVVGTPTIIFDDGTVTPGYLPAKTLIKKLGLDG